jgi:hypothetical protein
MPPHRAPEEQMQQMMEAQAQLMQVMTQFLANTQNNNNNNSNNNPPPPPPPQVDMLARFYGFALPSSHVLLNHWRPWIGSVLLTKTW